MIKFVWKEGTTFASRVDANVAGKRLQYLIRKHGDTITPDVIVEDARSKHSPLHNAFEWDDSIAATKYRERQARDLLTSVRVVMETKDGIEESIRVFVNVIDKDKGGVYVESMRAVEVDEYREQLFERAIREIDAWIKRYNELQELAELKHKLVEIKHLALEYKKRVRI